MLHTARQFKTTGKALAWGLLCLLFLLGSAHAVEPATIELDGQAVDLQLGTQLTLYSAPDDRYGPETLPPDALFEPSTKATHSLGYSHKTHWARFRLHNRSGHTLHLNLRQSYSLIDQLTLIRVNSDGSRETVKTGDHQPFSERPIPQASFLFPVNLAAGERADFYVSYLSEGQVNIDLRLQDNAALVTDLEEENLLKGAYFGGMLALVLYNLFLFWAIRDPNYLRYVVYTALYSLLQVSYNGIAFEYFWPDSPWWSNASLNMIVCFTNLAMIHFARHFLETATHLPRFNAVGRLLEAISLLLGIATPMLPYAFISKAAVGLALVNVAVIMTMSVVSLISGFKPARYFMTAWIVLLVGVIAAALKAFGVLPHNFFTEYSFQIGSYIEIVLLSMALADRMQQLKVASITDVLTKTFNRRHFDNRFSVAFDRVQGRDAFLSLIILDIDHFKHSTTATAIPSATRR